MRKRLPMTALITGLLAAPAMGGVALSPGAIGSPTSAAAPFVEAFPADMPAEVTLRTRRLARGEKLNAFGMQALQGNITRALSDRLHRAMTAAAGETLVSVQYDAVAPAPPPAGSAPTMSPVAAGKTVTFLGVRLEPAPDVLVDQLQLPHGLGLLVDEVTADSPAEKGGLKINDLLQKMDDQLLVNESQVQALVHTKKAGDAVTFTLLRGGQPVQLHVTLGEKQIPAVRMSPEPAPGASSVTRTFSSSSMTSHADGSVTRTLTDDQGTITMTRDKAGKTTVDVKDVEGKALYEGGPEGAAKVLPAELAKKVAELLGQRDEVHIEVAPPGNAATRTLTLERDDGVHRISLREDAAGRHLTVKEIATGKVLFDGAFQTTDDLLAQGVPAAVVAKVKMALEKLK